MTTTRSKSNVLTMEMEAAIRHKHDMADARAMMEARSRKKNTNSPRDGSGSKSKSSGAPSASNGMISVSQVHEALELLNQAEALDVQNTTRFGSAVEAQQRQALQLYQDAIHILIQFLRQQSSSSTRGDFDTATLQAYIQSALTNAEQLKAKLGRSNPQQASTTKPVVVVSPTSQRKENSQNLKNESTSWFSFMGVRNSTTNNDDGRKRNNFRNETKGLKPAKDSTEDDAKRITRKTKNPSTEHFTHQAQHNPPTSGPSTAPRSSPSNSTRMAFNDQLQHQILDEFYIPSSTLQKTTWDDVAGLKNVKQALQESVILPLQRPDLFQGLRRPQNLLLFGPPGTGKTLLVRATASTSRALLFQCSAASLTSKWMGDAEKVVRALFQVATAAARQHKTPALLFIDEVDSVLSSRTENEHEASRRLKTEFMIQMEGLAKTNSDDATNVLVLACTNCPWDLDPAVLRRFPRRLYVPLPDVEAREALLQHLLETQLKNDHSLSRRDVRELASQLEGYSGSDIYAIASQAAFGPIREVSAQQLSTVQKLRPVSRRDWQGAMESAPPPSVTPKLLQQYQDWLTKHNKL